MYLDENHMIKANLQPVFEPHWKLAISYLQAYKAINSADDSNSGNNCSGNNESGKDTNSGSSTSTTTNTAITTVAATAPPSIRYNECNRSVSTTSAFAQR